MTQYSNEHVTDLLAAHADHSLDPVATASVDAHLLVCEGCRVALSEWKVIEGSLRASTVAIGAPSRGLMDRVFQKIDGPVTHWYDKWLPRGARPPALRRLATAGIGALALAFTVTFTPVGSYAQGLLDRSQPQQFAIVPVTMADLEALPSLKDYGEVSSPQHEISPREVGSAAEAATATGMKVLTPAALPSGVTAAPSYAVIPSLSGTFTFSAARARAAANAQGKALPPMPALIDGSSVQVTTGKGVVTLYGARMPADSNSKAKPEGGRNPEEMVQMAPQLVIGQAFAPTATAKGASPKDLQQYLLSQPGISENLANAIRAIGDPTVTWPIPVPVGEIRTHSVTVQGVRGTVFQDTSGFVTGVIWVKDGIVYGVASQLGESDVLAIASSLR